MNAYSLANSQAVYEGQRSAAPDQRVFILTRSGFAGHPALRRPSPGRATSPRTWTTLRKQITAGLGFSIAGDPYWTTDTGGYTMQQPVHAGPATARRSTNGASSTRAGSSYSTFAPILRVHGTDRPREMWNIGDETTPVYQSELKFDKLRYALFPYIYSIAGAVTQRRLHHDAAAGDGLPQLT